MLNTAPLQPAARRPLVSPDSAASLSAERYTVQPGDTLSGIASRMGTTVASMMHANPQIEHADRLDVGEVLHLPADARPPQAPPQPAVHQIRPGDTLWQLARTHQTDVATLARLNHIRDPHRLQIGDVLRVPAQPSRSTQAVDRWMLIARGEVGQREVAGRRDNPRIVEYHQTTSLRATNDETPWCSSFVNWVLAQAGQRGTGSAAAISWKSWGEPVGGLPQARTGDIVVLHRHGAPATSNHVGFLVRSEDGRVTLLGGNQGNQVKESNYDLRHWEVVAVRRPG